VHCGTESEASAEMARSAFHSCGIRLCEVGQCVSLIDVYLYISTCLVEADDGVDGDDHGQHDHRLEVTQRRGHDGGCRRVVLW
jgi:hypothetical protein